MERKSFPWKVEYAGPVPRKELGKRELSTIIHDDVVFGDGGDPEETGTKLAALYENQPTKAQEEA